MLKIILFCLAILWISEHGVQNIGAKAQLEHSKQQLDCEGKGGKMRVFGPLGLAELMCFLPTKDEGKPCWSSNDCESYCIAPDKAIVGTKESGTCYGWQSLTGSCFSIVKDGIVQIGICYD